MKDMFFKFFQGVFLDYSEGDAVVWFLEKSRKYSVNLMYYKILEDRNFMGV